MMHPGEIKQNIFKLRSTQEFNALALGIFYHQYRYNPVYHEFVDLLGTDVASIIDPQEIPFLPIGFFKDHRIISGNPEGKFTIFSSSGTTASIPSRHFIWDAGIYRDSFKQAFHHFYGNPEQYRFLVLLPGYLERKGSSLVFMMDELVKMTAVNGSGFYLKEFEALSEELERPMPPGISTILFGASYALLDFAESYRSGPLDAMVMETGGMKGRKKEMVREELHAVLCQKFGVESIHSEYGMTELLSQAYSKGNGIYETPPWMKVLVRDINDPKDILPPGKTGGINVIDLANLHSCSFIATQDLGRVRSDGSFEVLGRFDDSDIRGCNLMVV